MSPTVSTFRDVVDGPVVALTPPQAEEVPEPDDVIVFTLPSCPQCNATKRALTKRGIPFRSVDLTEPGEADTLAALQEQRFAQAPIVVSPIGIWSGYSPDALDALQASRA